MARDLIAARLLQPVLLETKKILADVGASRVLGPAGAVRGMGQAVFNFLSKRKRHLSASLSQFDPKTGDHSVCQPLRIAHSRIAGEFEDTVGDHFTNAVGILRADTVSTFSLATSSMMRIVAAPSNGPSSCAPDLSSDARSEA